MTAPPRRPLDSYPQGDAPTRPSASNCVGEEELAAFVQGGLSATERAGIEHHADRCEPCASLMHEAMRALNTALGSELDGSGTDFAVAFPPGTVVAGRYEVRRFIARGGMGEVYEAFDRQLQERVALKTVSATASDSPRAIRDFKAEVQLARRVTHANVCRIYDLGTHTLKYGGLVHFLTMEFVEGETLGQILRTRGPLPLEQCERFAKALLQGLAAAHSAGILHRDFKSDNVMVRRDGDGQLTPVILDFGLARHLDERSRARSSGQALVGTLTYMAPEQVEGAPLSRATDIYAFGVVWFEMLTGKIPFAGPPQLSALERLTKSPDPPSRLNRQVPRVVDGAVLRCLARLPSQRFQSAPDVLSSLDVSTALPAGPSGSLPLRLGAATLLGAGLLFFYALVRYETTPKKIALTMAPAMTSAPAAPTRAADPPAGVPVNSATASQPAVAALVPRPSALKGWKGAAAAKAKPASPPAATPTSASSGAFQPEPAKRQWTFGRIPLPVTSGSAAAHDQNRTP